MEREKMKIHRGSLWLRLICGILCCGAITTAAWSRYQFHNGGRGEAVVARFVTGSEFHIDPASLPQKPGETTQVKFMVTNFEGEQVSEAMLGYQVTPETAGNLPLTFQLNRDEASVAADSNWIPDGELTGNTASTDGIFQAGQAAVHHYRLTINWPVLEDGENADYADEVDYVRVKIQARQISPAA